MGTVKGIFPISGIMNRTTAIKIVSLLTLVIPVQVFVIGDFYGKGFQTPLFRYIDTIFGRFLILISRDGWEVLKGTVTGQSVISVIVWIFATAVLTLSVILVLIPAGDRFQNLRRAGKLIIVSGILYLFSIILEYGLLFHNEYGISIPLGVPLLVLLGYWIYREGRQDSGPEGIQASEQETEHNT